MQEFRIHGDNVVECERTFALIARAFAIPDADAILPSGSPLTPTFSIRPRSAKGEFRFTFFPGYRRWNIDIIEIIRRRGGRLREAVDAVVTRVVNGVEEAVLALEYCGALPAGNQAWQRNGRALSFAHAGLPFVYIAELSGYELNAKRQRKAARMPNPAVPFSYLLLTEETGSPALPVFVRSPGASQEAVKAHTPFYGEAELIEFISCALLGKDTNRPRRALERKVLDLVKFLAGTRKANDTLSPQQWTAAFTAAARGQSIPSQLARQPAIPWKKTAYIQGLTPTAKQLMSLTARCARGLTSTSLPMCLVVEEDRAKFATALARYYRSLPKSFLRWCSGKGHLAVCWIMGFKPGGDDARPDRGLPPLCRMLVGTGTDMLTIVYGPAPKSTWRLLESNPTQLMENNGLWESVLVCSDAVLIDATTLDVPPPMALLKNHWTSKLVPQVRHAFAVNPSPVTVGENDVDTVLHLLFCRLGQEYVFEGMCNPPGGDWSGLSLLTNDRTCEHRWLGLPRVTAADAKRPDHVFQIFDGFNPFFVLAIESKESARSVENRIGPRLRKYVGSLIESTPSVRRTGDAAWSHYAEAEDRRPPQIATAAAFVLAGKEELTSVASRATVDLVLGCAFPPSHDACVVIARSCTPIGQSVCRLLESLDVADLNLRFEIQS